MYTYIQQTVLATKSSHIKVSSQVSLIDYLVFKQQKTIWVWGTHRKNDSLTKKFIKNHHMAVTSLVKHTLPHTKTSRIYLTPAHPLTMDVIYWWPSIIFLINRELSTRNCYNLFLANFVVMIRHVSLLLWTMRYGNLTGRWYGKLSFESKHFELPMMWLTWE